jgi:multiple sugar transport system permease protein
MFKGMLKVEWGPLMAGSILALLPVVIVFFLVQKYFVEGVKMSGIKG